LFFFLSYRKVKDLFSFGTMISCRRKRTDWIHHDTLLIYKM